jgi:hypothetical protein
MAVGIGGLERGDGRGNGALVWGDERMGKASRGTTERGLRLKIEASRRGLGLITKLNIENSLIYASGDWGGGGLMGMGRLIRLSGVIFCTIITSAARDPF